MSVVSDDMSTSLRDYDILQLETQSSLGDSDCDDSATSEEVDDIAVVSPARKIYYEYDFTLHRVSSAHSCIVLPAWDPI
jgi:hypothetical protein